MAVFSGGEDELIVTYFANPTSGAIKINGWVGGWKDETHDWKTWYGILSSDSGHMKYTEGNGSRSGGPNHHIRYHTTYSEPLPNEEYKPGRAGVCTYTLFKP